MKAKEYLKQYRLLKLIIEQKKKDIREFEHDIASLKAIDYTKDRVQCSHDDVIASCLAKLNMMRASAHSDIERLFDIYREIIKMIDKVADFRCRTLLHYRYIECLTFEDIAEEMNYSYRQVLRLHGIALQEIKVHYDKDVT